ncbi:MAG: hypothetical protein J4F47_02805 [Alphaproteobacteria bacterium]|nr:hypothetical protein [Alphaproteobacteria bacterium]
MAFRYLNGPVFGLGVALIFLPATSGIAAAQELSLNYESLSSLEEPLATEIGDITLVLTGLLDISMSNGSEDNGAPDASLIGNAQVAALGQLAGFVDLLRPVCDGCCDRASFGRTIHR